MKNDSRIFRNKTPMVSLIVISMTLACLGKPSMDSLNKQAMEECLTPVRPGLPGKQPFWNQFSMQFIFAPAFDFKEVRKATSYKFTALSFANRKTYTFSATHPWAPLSPIWNSLPVGEVFLNVAGVDSEGKAIELSGERKFYRAAPFHGPYHTANSDYATAAKRQLDYIFQLDHVQHWINHKTPDSNYVLNAYPSKMIQATVTAMLKYTEIHAGEYPENCEKALLIATNAADYLIGQSEPSTAPLAFLPPTYAGDKLAARLNQGKIMINVCVGMGQTYLTLHQVTQKEKYLQAAINIADTLLKVQLPSGTWPIKMKMETGKQDTPNFGIPTGIINFLDRISAHHKNPQYLLAKEKAWRWILENPLKTFNWEGQFEDVQPSDEAYKLMGMHDPCGVASYLMAHKQDDPTYLDKALEILRFIEDQFVVWEKPLPFGQRGESTSTWFTPSVLEQYICYTPIDASVSRVSAIFKQAYEATGNELYLEKSKALANSLTQQQGSDGNIPTGWDTVPPTRIRTWWLNCATGGALFLLNYGNQENPVP